MNFSPACAAARRVALSAALSGVILAPLVRAQSAPPPASEDKVQVLTPFEVQADSDKSYGALNSNSITSFNAKLEKLPISADILTSTFMEDTESTNVEEMLKSYSAGSGTSSPGGDPAGSPVNNPLDRGGGGNVGAGVSIRGLASATVKQDSFMAPSNTGTSFDSVFGLERVEVINGPQSLLYGTGGAGGVINLVSRQARIDQPSSIFTKFQVDQYGNKTGQFDYDVSAGPVAVIFSAIDQNLGNYRVNIGGPLHGLYSQIAVKVKNTVVRFSVKSTDWDRFLANSSTSLNAGSATIDSRNGDTLHYLLATNQVNQAASGPSGAGPILNGLLDWKNVDSLWGHPRDEHTIGHLYEGIADSVWTSWFSTRISAGYQANTDIFNATSTLTFYSPTATSNTLPGNWTVNYGPGTGYWASEPSRTKALRAEGLVTNDWFDGKAHSQTSFGADTTRSDYANISYAYFQADDNFNVIRSASVTAHNGRTPLAGFSWAVNQGPIAYPWISGTPARITVQGQNYVAMINNEPNPALITSSDPQGVVSSATGGYIHSTSIAHGVFAVNNTEWMGGALDTLLGVRYQSAYERQTNANNPTLEEQGSKANFSAGANYGLFKWLRPYVSVSDSYNIPAIVLTSIADPLGNPGHVSNALGEEAGVKLDDDRGLVSGSLAVYAVQSKGEAYQIIANLTTDINPAGLNGRVGGPGNYITVNRKSRGSQATLSITPTPNWRMRLSAAFIQGTIGNSTGYAQLYNDQFHADSSGNVTYADGTVVYVNSTFNSKTLTVTSATAGAIPLTVALMNNSTSPYYANPAAITQTISSASNVGKVLAVVDPTHGAILTGAVGLPISALQIAPNGIVPGTIITSVAGDSTTGSPEHSFNFTNLYTFPTGWIKGFELGGSVQAGWRRNDYYYYPGGFTSPSSPRSLFDLPTTIRFDGIVGYKRKVGRVLWSTQLNVQNMFNQYKVVILPNNITGYTAANGVGQDATFNQLPRAYVWTNTLRF